MLGNCDHDLAERETACADGMCPECLHMELIYVRGMLLGMTAHCPDLTFKKFVLDYFNAKENS